MLMETSPSDVFQVGPEHVGDDPRISPEEQGVFRHEEITALFAQAGDVDAAAADTDLSVFDDQALAARRREAVVDEIGQGASQIEDGRAPPDRLSDHVGALPFFLSGRIPNYVDALFETASGFTTTGSSILSEVEAIGKGLLFWRSFTHWIGGMGVLVLIQPSFLRAAATRCRS